MNEITHTILIELGFVEIPTHPQRYVYKGVTGRFEPELNLFVFHGFSLPIGKASDLRYMMWLIDYQENATFEPYPSNLNLN